MSKRVCPPQRAHRYGRKGGAVLALIADNKAKN
jgi:hypothetical protein